jgi:hypothetical protein
VKAATLTQNKVVRKAVEFTLAVAIKRAREEEAEDGKPKAPLAGIAKAQGSTP